MSSVSLARRLSRCHVSCGKVSPSKTRPMIKFRSQDLGVEYIKEERDWVEVGSRREGREGKVKK